MINDLQRPIGDRELALEIIRKNTLDNQKIDFLKNGCDRLENINEIITRLENFKRNEKHDKRS